MSRENVVAIKDENGYRIENWRYADYQKMQDTLDEQLAEGIILDWWIDN